MNFNEEINRYGTNCLKYDFKNEYRKPEDVFPMWIADMDFKLPNEVLEDMRKRVDHGIFGYTDVNKEYFEALRNWFSDNFDVMLENNWLVVTPGVVFALAMAVRTLTNENEAVLINNPVYFPFSEVIVKNKRKAISSDLVLRNGHYEIDFEDFECKIKQNKIKLYLFCSPHNPVGRVWKKEELDRIVGICKRNNVYIVSDEIHSDFVWEGTHISLLKYANYLNNIMVCTSPSKTFNMAGLQTSNIFIPDENIKRKFLLEAESTGYSYINVFGMIACESAYRNGKKWLLELKEYIKENIELVDNFLKTRLPNVKLIKPEGTYLLWIDFSGTGLSDEEINNKILNRAKLWFNSGTMFGKTGYGFQRVNIAMPKEKLKWALHQLETAFKEEK